MTTLTEWRMGIGPILVILQEHLFIRVGPIEVLYEKHALPEIACGVGGSLAVLGCVWFWSMYQRAR